MRKLTPVRLKAGDELYGQNQPIQNIYFPLSGVLSLVTTAGDDTGEVATVGKEGMLGLPILLGTDRIPMRAFAQVPGEALMMPVKDFKTEIKNPRSKLSRILYRYAQALFVQVAQHAACNATHQIRQRCARWLLMTHDRVGTDEFQLTQDFLSQMLGVRRAGVSVAAADLQRDRLITYRRGMVKVLDRKGLEKASCDHYGIVKAEYERLMEEI
ncbi:MAG TPA: Crp/Fnr family transcriptional regulator [Nitrospira sp.]|nr:Crp/Fnr family transcriptional regulator [Nitrospira sp.]